MHTYRAIKVKRYGGLRHQSESEGESVVYLKGRKSFLKKQLCLRLHLFLVSLELLDAESLWVSPYSLTALLDAHPAV